jgi:hypothetical protein
MAAPDPTQAALAQTFLGAAAAIAGGIVGAFVQGWVLESTQTRMASRFVKDLCRTAAELARQLLSGWERNRFLSKELIDHVQFEALEFFRRRDVLALIADERVRAAIQNVSRDMYFETQYLMSLHSDYERLRNQVISPDLFADHQAEKDRLENSIHTSLARARAYADRLDALRSQIRPGFLKPRPR